MMKINYKELARVIDELKLEDYEEIIYGGRTSLIMFNSLEDGETDYHYPSQLVDGCNIYIAEELDENSKREQILHEVMEFSLIRDVLGEEPDRELVCFRKRTAKEVEDLRARIHRIAAKCSERYARERI